MLTIEPRTASLELDGMTVGRLLPWVRRRMVGPFIFMDAMGPAEFQPGAAMDVRPHPHIGLATVTYLFDGEIVHRDSLGCTQVIRPGEINWMTSGRGIAHSERTPDGVRERGGRLHGLQLWVALPREEEECAPRFDHVDSDALPESIIDGVTYRLLAGSAYGMTSPVPALSPLVYAEVRVPAGAALQLPDEHPELGVYVVEGVVDGFDPRKLHVFDADRPTLRATEASRVMIIGGSPFPEKRHIWWNFVSSSAERIERAKVDWLERRFPVVIGDEEEYVPLPPNAMRQSPAAGRRP